MKLSLVRTTLVAFLGLAVHASAEIRVCIGGDLDHLTVTQKNSCRASADQVRLDAAKFHAPDDWHFFVVCTEEDWSVYAKLTQKSATLASVDADTDIAKHTTFLRGASIAADSYRMHRLIAHEAASGLLKSQDETAIQKQMSVWIPEQNGEGAVLMASR